MMLGVDLLPDKNDVVIIVRLLCFLVVYGVCCACNGRGCALCSWCYALIGY
jgi:hypothetical protein